MDEAFLSFEAVAEITTGMRLSRGQGRMVASDRVWCHALALPFGEIAHVFYPDGSRCEPSDVGAPLVVFRSGGTCQTSFGATQGFSDLSYYPDGRRTSSAYYGGVHEFQILATGKPDCATPCIRLPATHVERVWRLILLLRNDGDLDRAGALLRDIVGAAQAMATRRLPEIAKQTAKYLGGAWPSGNRSACVAQRLGVSEAHLCRQFRRAYGTSISRYVRIARLNWAAGLLWGTSLPISEVALMCGFSDQSHLTRELDALLAQTPHAFRRLAPCLGNPRLSKAVHPTASVMDFAPVP